MASEIVKGNADLEEDLFAMLDSDPAFIKLREESEARVEE